MDHLPKLGTPASPSSRVPYVQDSRFTYIKPFATFASRCKPPDLSGNDPTRSQAYAAYAQSWLYFGFIEAFFEVWKIPFAIKDFLEDTKDGSIVTSKFLNDYLVATVAFEHNEDQPVIADRALTLTSDESSYAMARARKRMQASYSVLQTHHQQLQLMIDQDIQPLIWDSLAILGATLTRAQDLIFRPIRDEMQLDMQLIDHSVFLLRSVPDFRYNGEWCPYERKVVAELVGGRLPEIAFLSQLKALSLKESERLFANAQSEDRTWSEFFKQMLGLKPDRSHSECDKSRCVAYQISDSSYKTRHTDPGCRCDFVGFSDGTVPVTQSRNQLWACTFTKGRLELVHLPVPDPQASVRLVAFSHVWADRLGNVVANELPRCQLNNLQDLANSLHSETHHPVPFWIDTLLIPRFSSPSLSSDDKRRRDDARSRALGNMEWIYKVAEHVLVLDRRLMALSTSTMGVEEIGAYLMTSTWSRRLWTFQEGCNKNRTVFKFKDQVVSWPSLHDRIQEGCKLSTWESQSQLPKDHPVRKAQQLYWMQITWKSFWGSKPNFWPSSPRLWASTGWSGVDQRLHKVVNQVWHSVHAFLEEMTVDWSGDAESSALIRCMRGLYYRNCSDPADEPLVLASLLSRDAGFAARLKSTAKTAEDRYKEIFTKFDYVPRDILFLDQARHEAYGCRWIPKSLLAVNNSSGKLLDRKDRTDRVLAFNALPTESIAEDLKSVPESLVSISKADSVVDVAFGLFTLASAGASAAWSMRAMRQNSPVCF